MIGEKIGEYLDENGITQAFLAEKAKMTPISVSMVVNGARKVSAEEYIRICRALKLDLEYFADDVAKQEERRKHERTENL